MDASSSLAAMDVAFAAPPTISWRDIPGEVVLYDSQSGAYHALNASAAEIWRLLAGGRSGREAVESLSLRYGVDRDTLADDVATFIRGALAKGFLVTEQGH